MLWDPLQEAFTTLGIAESAYSAGATSNSGFVAISRNDTNSTYRWTISSTNYIDCFIGHQFGKRNRYTMRFTEYELVSNPADTTANIQKSTSYSIVADRSVLGAATHETALCSILSNFLRKTTDGQGKFVTRVLAGET